MEPWPASKATARLKGNDVPIRPSSDTQAVRGQIVPLALGIGAYAVLAVLAYWPVLPFDASKLPTPPGTGAGDPVQMAWFLAWTPFALIHGHNPFFTSYLDVPYGVNLAANTSVPLLGLVATPLTLALGPIASFNVLMRVALAGSATSMFLVSRRWVSWWPAAFASGLLYGFSSYMTYEGSLHLDLAFMVVPPILLWCLDELLVTQARSPVKTGALLGLLSAAQLLIDPEVFLYCCMLAVVGLALIALAHRREVFTHLRVAVPGLLAGLGCFAAVAGYQIGYFLAGPRRIPHGIALAQSTPAFHVDLLRPILSSPAHVTNTSGYLGIGLLVVLVVLAVIWRGVGIIQLASACAFVAYVVSLGPRLTVDGHRLAVWLPAAALEHVPLLQNLLPVRITGLEMLSLGIVLGVGLDRTYDLIVGQAGVVQSSNSATRGRLWLVTRSVGTRPRLLAGGVLAVVLVTFVPLLGQLPIVREHRVSEPELTASLAHSVPDGGVVLAFPYPRARDDAPMLWQAADEMSFRLVGGYALVPGSTGRGRYFISQGPDLARLSALLTAPAAPSLSLAAACRSLDAVLRSKNVDALVLATKRGLIRSRGIGLLTRLLGPPALSLSAASVWYDLESRRPTPTCPVDHSLP